MAFAQDQGTGDLKGGIGFETSNDFLNTVDDIVSGVSYTNSRSTPAFNLAYRVAVADNWFVFADVAYQVITEDMVDGGIVVGDVANRYITVGFGSDYHYISKDWFQMYSGLSIAFTSQNSDFTSNADIKDESDGYFNFHVNAVGVRFGKSFGGFAEFGLGYRGVANIGLSYQLAK